MINLESRYSPYGYGWYAFVDNNILYIGHEAPREGGLLYEGEYQKEKTPFLKTIMYEDIYLYESIVKYFEGEVKYYFPRFVKRSQEDNRRFTEYLESAIDKAEQAISNITYSSYPETNELTIRKIRNACKILEEVLDEMDIKKPM